MATTTTKMEFSVKMSCSSCAAKVKSKLAVAGIHDVVVDVPNCAVLVETNLITSRVQSLLESTGLPVFFKGFGSSIKIHDVQQGAAVVALKGESNIIGLVRMVQSSAMSCVIEATMEGLPIGRYRMCVHELGDLSQQGYSCGDIFGCRGDEEAAGYLGEIEVNQDGRPVSLQVVSERLNVEDIIGRSVVVSKGDLRIMYGIIARSAGLFENPKQMCTCDGVSIWDEANKSKLRKSS